MRVVEVGDRAGFLLKASPLPFRGEFAASDQLEGDDAFETDLPGFEDHAHAADAELFQQLIVAEGARHRGPAIPSQVVDPILIVEELAKAVGYFRVPGQELGAIGRLARIDPQKVRSHGLLEAVLQGR